MTPLAPKGIGRDRVLVTGATGFVGRRCVGDLIERGYEVHGASRGTRGPDANVVWHAADLLEPGAGPALIDAARPTHLVHLAWETTHGAFWSSPDNLRWLAASVDLVRAFAEGGGRRAVVAGTCAEYRWSGTAPLSEMGAPREPRTLYGAAKHGLHVAVAAYADEVGFDLAWGRIFFLYGPDESPGRLVRSVAEAMLRGEQAPCTHGRQVRDFLHVADAGRAFAALLASEVTGPVNIASGDPVSIADVAETLATITGRFDLLQLGALPAAADDPPVLVADVARLRQEVGWAPAHDLSAGLRCTVEALRPPVSA